MTGETNARVCRCCGSTRVRAAGTKQGGFVKQLFHYHRCEDCSLLFIEPFLGPEIYNDAYYQGAGPDPFVNYESEYADYRKTDRLLEMQDLVRVARELLQAQPRPRVAIDWFDFGCGAGSLLKYLRDRGSVELNGAKVPMRLTGHDVGVWADRLREHDQFRIVGEEDLRNLPDASFDVISMVEVLEHIPYPAPVIQLAARLLKPGGALVLTTGNMNAPVARRQGLNYRYCISELHISLFSPSCLRRLYEDAGLQPKRVRYRGVVAFKVVKSLLGPRKKTLARSLVRVPLVLRAIDRAYGVSEMPCAVKPLEH